MKLEGLPSAARIQILMITNKSTKNEGPSENMGFNRKSWRISDKKEKENTSNLYETTP